MMDKIYWIIGIRKFTEAFHKGPDKKHNDWVWREFLKLNRIMRAEQCLPTMCLMHLIVHQD